MANTVYNPYKESILDSSCPDLSGGDVKWALVDTADYTFSAAHEFYSSVNTGGAVEAESANLASKTITDGVFDAADDPDAFTTPGGDTCEALVLFHDSGVDATSELVLYIDTATGLAITFNGGNVGLVYNASGILTF